MRLVSCLLHVGCVEGVLGLQIPGWAYNPYVNKLYWTLKPKPLQTLSGLFMSALPSSSQQRQPDTHVAPWRPLTAEIVYVLVQLLGDGQEVGAG